MTGLNRDLVARALAEENGDRHVAWVCSQPFAMDPEAVAAEMRALIPADALPDIVFLMAKDYVLAGIEPADETPKARKMIAARTAVITRLFGDELKEGGRRAHEKLRREMGR